MGIVYTHYWYKSLNVWGFFVFGDIRDGLRVQIAFLGFGGKLDV